MFLKHRRTDENPFKLRGVGAISCVLFVLILMTLCVNIGGVSSHGASSWTCIKVHSAHSAPSCHLHLCCFTLPASLQKTESTMAFSTRSIQWSSSSRAQTSAPSVSSLTSRKMSLQKIQAPSVYGGAGGFGTRISTSSSSGLGGSLQVSVTGSDVLLAGNEKSTMQNLNDRLAAYLERVRSLEKSNSLLEKQIREWYEKNTVSVGQDYSSYFKTIEELRSKVRDHRACQKYRHCNYQ